MTVSTISATGLAGSVSQLGKNLVQNGAMTVAQRGTQTGQGAASAYTAVDRWKIDINASPQARVTTSQDTSVPAGGGFSYSLKVDCTTAESAVAAGETMHIAQNIEAQNLQRLDYGAAGAKTITLSFWVSSPKTGTHCVSIDQQDGGSTFIREFTVAVVNTWEQFTVTFPGDTSGTINNDTGTGLTLIFPLLNGSTYQDDADAWTGSGTKWATSNQQNLLDNTANNFYIGGVQLEVGSVATDFEHEDYGTTLAKCQRYYWQLGPAVAGAWLFGNGTSINTSSCYTHHRYPVEMRAGPTLGTSGTAGDYQIRHNATTACNAVPVFSLSGSATPNAAATQAASMTWSGNSALTAGESGALQAVNTSAILTFDAEL
jgi:hypothetical protein